MNEIEQQTMCIGNALFELWHLLPEPKKSYTNWYLPISDAIDDWHLSSREKKIAKRKKWDKGVK